MNRRLRIRKKFQNNFRYRSSVHGGPPKPPPPPVDQPPPPPPRGTPVTPVGIRVDEFTGNVRVYFADANGHVYSANFNPRSRYVLGENSGVTAEDIGLDPALLGLASDSSAGPLPGSRAATASAASAPIWIRIPEGQLGQDILRSVARFLSPSGGVAQDGLRALLNSPQFQALFQGGQLAQGAAQMFSSQQLFGLLLPPSMLAENPELAKSLLIAQGLPAGLIQNIPDRAISGALQSLLQTGGLAGQNPLHFLQSVASALTLAGTPVQDVQNLLLGLLQAARQQGIGEHATPEQLQALTAKLLAGNNPQLLGLNQMVQENFGQGLTQIFNAFIRVFMGGALLQGQQQWPQVVPNERLLAEMAALFGAFSGKDATGKKEERRRDRKTRRKEIKIDDPAFQRVERKEDLGDEPRQQEEAALESIFINVDD